MSFIEPNYIEVVSMSSYEYVHYIDDKGHHYLSLHQEVGFSGFSESVILTEDEVGILNKDKKLFVANCISSVNLETRTFEFHKNQRNIPEFHKWACVKSALDTWHGRTNT